MSVRSAQSVTVLFTTRVFSTGVGTNADSLPTGVLYLNGTANGATVTVTNISAGLYKAAVTLPTLAVGDEVEIIIAATVSTIADTAVVWGDTKDFFAGAIPDVAAGGTNGLFIAGTNAATVITTSLTTHLVGTVDTLTTYTGNTPQTGDAFALIGTAGAGLTALGDARITHLNADVSSRMATYTQPTGFLAATFPIAVASPTNITAGTITAVTTLTNLPPIPVNWLTAAGVEADAVTKIQAGLSTYAGGDTAGTTTLLTRVSGSVALASQIPANFTAATFVSAGVFSVGALANSPSGGGVVDANIVQVNSVPVTGAGTDVSPWGP
jgi:hypothetical protein